MQTCIICRQQKTDFNDEHVIPDSIQGYYHIRKVCVDCNSRMGSQIDNKLTNHKFIEFQRHLLKIKGKSGNIPNPLAGTHTLKDDPHQKVQLQLDDEGNFTPRLVPNVPRDITGSSFTIIIDKKDEHKKEEIIRKFLSRNGIAADKVQTESSYHSEQPWITTKMEIDLHNFKLGMLKIAYEFAVDKLPAYFNDATAEKISSILYNADFDALKTQVTMVGDGFNHQVLAPFSHLLELENNNHYLILFDGNEQGLLCFINLFNTFSIGFKMSESSGFVQDSLLVGKNDLVSRSFRTYSIGELISQTYTPLEYRFKYYFPDHESVQAFLQNDRHPEFDFYRENDKIPFLNSDGEIVYEDIDRKLQQPQLQHIHKGDEMHQLVTEIVLDEDLYIKLFPINKLYKVISVQLEQFKKNKL